MVTLFVIELWSTKQSRWIATGNARRSFKAASELLLDINKRQGGDRQIARYERSREQGKGRTRSDGKRTA